MSQQLPADLIWQIRAYADMIVKCGLNVEKGETVLIVSPVDCSEFARLITNRVYAAGAARVHVLWIDEQIDKQMFEYASIEECSVYPRWLLDIRNDLAEEGASLLLIDSGIPGIYSGVDAAKLQAYTHSRVSGLSTAFEKQERGEFAWCIAGAANPEWAKEVFKDAEDESIAMELLWKAILSCCHVPERGDGIHAWRSHEDTFEEKKITLNSLGIRTLHYSNALGTNLSIGLRKSAIWHGGCSYTVEGKRFSPNMPTEEIYTSPDMYDVNGIVYASRPFSYQGNTIDGMWVRFEDGLAIDWGAKSGSEFLNNLMNSDAGSRRLGELALVPWTSPIRETDLMFWSILFDENACCHLALGASFPECCDSGLSMSGEELEQHGMNSSLVHQDFMIGTEDLIIKADLFDGTPTCIFQNGEWAI